MKEEDPYAFRLLIETIKQQDFLSFNEQRMQGFEVPKVQQQQNFAELINQL